RPISQIVDDGVRHFGRFRPLALGVETNQFQVLLKNEFQSALESAGFVSASIIPLTNQTNKLMRIRTLGPLLASRRLRFVTRSPGTRMLVEQLREFPLARHDDGPDAAEMAIRLAGMITAPVPQDQFGDNLLRPTNGWSDAHQ